MIEIAPGWLLPGDEYEVRFVRSAGPGGQNVNKLSTKAELRFHLDRSVALSAGQKARLRAAYPSHATRAGEFVVSSDRHRTQAQNQQDCRQRLAAMIRSIRHPPRPRVPTRPTQASRRRRLTLKRARGVQKRLRGKADAD